MFSFIKMLVAAFTGRLLADTPPQPDDASSKDSAM